MQPIPTRGGLNRDDDLREIIRETLRQRGVNPDRRLVEDIYTLCIKVAANEQYQELRKIIAEKIKNLRLE